MGVNAEVTKRFNNGNVQVEISSKNTKTQYYEVPANRADSFIKAYKERNKKDLYLSNTVFAGSILGGTILTNALIRKIIKNKFVKFTLATIGGIAACTLATIGTWNHMDKKRAEMMKKYQAKKIFYSA